VLGRRSWWAVVAIVLLGVGGGVVAWDRHTLRASQETVSVLLVLGRHGTGQATISVRRGRLGAPGPFAERVASLLMPTAHQSPTQIYTDLLDRSQMIDVPRRGIESSTRLGRHRWRVERALSWLSCYRRLAVRRPGLGDVLCVRAAGRALVCCNRLTGAAAWCDGKSGRLDRADPPQ
jgi:hypothetical protein